MKVDSGITVTDALVKKVLKERLDMRYRPIKGVSNTANTHKNMILRQQFAYRMLELLQQGKRILNIDETWLNDTNFARRKWRRRGTSNSMRMKQVLPRLSVIAAVDTEGSVYVSLTQVNTDTPIMKIYLS